MKILTWNVNNFNGSNWNLMDNNWADNEDIKRENNANKIFEKVTSIIEQPDDIAILQEFPYQDKWKNIFDNEYKNHTIISWYYNDSDKEFRVEPKYGGITVAIVKNNSWWYLRSLNGHKSNKNKKVDYSNRYIEMYNADEEINLLGVHPNDAHALIEWLSKNYDKRFVPNIIVGDFNAENYIKANSDVKFVENRREFLRLTEGFIDVCNGMVTTNYKRPTQIDHILIQNSDMFIVKIKKRDVFYSMDYSDHYPLFAEIDLTENDVNKFIPSKDIASDIWRVETAHGIESSTDVNYIASEFAGVGLIYHYMYNGEMEHDHSFDGILEEVLRKPKYIELVTEFGEYSQQQIQMVEGIKNAVAFVQSQGRAMTIAEQRELREKIEQNHK